MKNNNVHNLFMSRCIDIARKGYGTAYPNPCVGCVIVYENRIIAEACSSEYGGNHAEINAINKVRNKKILEKSTLYVTLEPCCHHGKTPPCSQAIIKNRFPIVVVGTIDTSEKVKGKGILELKKNNINVITGVLEKECTELHKNFLCFHEKKRPYIILKWAESKDHFIHNKNITKSKNKWISTKKSRQLVHKWRSMENAILVGYNTVINDNPRLNVRHWEGNNPVRIVIDPNDELNKDYNIFNSHAKTIKISRKNINLNNPLAKEIIKVLYQNKIQSVIVEGGKKTLESFINTNLWDEARVFTNNRMLGGGISSPKIGGKIFNTKKIDDDVLKIIYPF